MAGSPTPSPAADRGDDRTVVVVGAGPAGLTAAWVLTREGVDVEVLEADPDKVGGISRTEDHGGYRFDIGGHRFFTKADEVEKLWHEILPAQEWLHVERMSRIYYRGVFFDYPLKASDALRKLGLFESVLCVLSYLKARALPRRDVRSFEDWTVNHFGWRLYRIFFKTYTEKVWGRPCTEISADWAAQRIKGLSLLSAVRNALPTMPWERRRRGGDAPVIKTLIETFAYPRLGPGQMWEHAAAQVEAAGNPVRMGTRVVGIDRDDAGVMSVTVEDADGRRQVHGTDYVTSMPLSQLVQIMDPPAPDHVREAADLLEYRDYLTIVLVVDREEVFPDNWIYIHEPEVQLGRIQNYKNWSPHMVPDASRTALGLEYFTTAGDLDLWETDDETLIAMGIEESARIGLVDPAEVLDATVVRMRRAYPVYDEHYAANVEAIRVWLDEAVPNLQTVGRNGMHKYNNQDHSMMAALLAARNLLGEDWDPWKVNTDAEYHEEVRPGADTAGRGVPGKAAPLPGR
ncbi:MAG: NAD(P)/FAD-dependent oxidoreductase [Nitriliruptor sp.]